MKITLSFAFLVSALTLSMFSLAFAQTAQLGIDSDASVGMDDVIEVDADTNVGVEAQTGISETEVGTEATVTGTIETDSDANSGDDVMVDNDTVVITRASAEASEAGMVSTASSVQTQADLSAYATTVVKSDTNVERVELADDSVSLRYQQRAKLLGVVPVFVTVKATVGSDGEISLQRPWYGFLLTMDSDADLEASVNAAAQTALSGSTAVNANGDFTTRAQAMLLQEVHTVMKNHLEASLSMEAAANASAQAE